MKKNNSLRELNRLKNIFRAHFFKEFQLWVDMVDKPAFNIKFVTSMLRDFKKITIEDLKARGYDVHSIILDWANPSRIALPFILYWILKHQQIDKIAVYAYNRSNFYINDMRQIKIILNYWLVYKETSKFLENQENNRILLVIFKGSLIRLLRNFMTQIRYFHQKKGR